MKQDRNTYARVLQELTKTTRNLRIPTIAIVERMENHITEKKDVVPIRIKESIPLRAESNHTIDMRSIMFPKCINHFRTMGYAFLIIFPTQSLVFSKLFFIELNRGLCCSSNKWAALNIDDIDSTKLFTKTLSENFKLSITFLMCSPFKKQLKLPSK